MQRVCKDEVWKLESILAIDHLVPAAHPEERRHLVAPEHRGEEHEHVVLGDQQLEHALQVPAARRTRVRIR